MMQMTRLIALPTLAALILSCNSDQPVCPNDGTTGGAYNKTNGHVFTLGFGESMLIEPENLVVTFNAVLHDSRCPSDVICFWEGMAIVQLRLIALPADTHFVDVTAFGGCPEDCWPASPPTDTLGYRLRLLNLEPYPISTEQITDSEYVAMLAVFPHPPLNPIDGEVIISNEHPSTILGDSYRLDTVSIDGNVMSLTAEFGGGCREHEFELHMSPAAFFESLPVQANLYLNHDDNDDPCDAVLRRTLRFDLRPIAHQHEIMYGHLDCVILNVFRYQFDSIPSDRIRVVYHPEGSPPTTWCDQFEAGD